LRPAILPSVPISDQLTRRRRRERGEDGLERFLVCTLVLGELCKGDTSMTQQELSRLYFLGSFSTCFCASSLSRNF
jgi:hypothetical protein